MTYPCLLRMDEVGMQTTGDVTGSRDLLSKNACIGYDCEEYSVMIMKPSIQLLLYYTSLDCFR